MTYHFCFPQNYFLDADTPIHLKKRHPTWKLTTTTPSYDFGGLLEAHDNNPLFKIITLHTFPEGIKVTGLDKLVLGVHVREVNDFQTVFYQHDANGFPHKIGELEVVEDYFDEPILETIVAFSQTPKRWHFQDWASSNGRENLFRLGGEPTWIQGADVPVCPISNEKMGFLMQLDTDLPTVDGNELFFGSGGICYVFWCDTSKVSCYFMQCT